MRAGHGSLLLNVNTTTSAFYSPVKLTAWMGRKWSTDLSKSLHDGEFKKWLRGVKVTLDCHPQRRKFTIFDFDGRKISQVPRISTKIPGGNGKTGRVAVASYLLQRKFISTP